jgi:RNA polymerase sigma factor (sigma-70 family)
MADSVKEYLNAIARYPLLSTEQEIQLSRQVHAMREIDATADITPQQQRIMKRGQKAKNTIISCNLRLVVHIAKKYVRRLSGSHMEMMDLIQEGNVGLHRAAELFDGSKGYKFSTYAYWWIRQAMTRAIDTQERMIRVPQHSLERIYRAVKLQEEYIRQHGQSPSMATLAKLLEIDVDELAMLLARNAQIKSLDSLITEDGSPLIDFIADERLLNNDHTYDEQNERMEQLELAFFRLDKNDRNAIAKRYGIYGAEQQSNNSIAAEEGVSRETIRHRVQCAERRLRLLVSGSKPRTVSTIGVSLRDAIA